MIQLEKITIVVDQTDSPVILNAVNDLKELLQKTLKADIEVAEKSALKQNYKTLIWVGKSNELDLNLLQDINSDLKGEELAGQEALIFASPDNRNNSIEIVLTGGGDQGVQYAVFEFMNRLHIFNNEAFIPRILFYREKPTYQLRGMYAHLHWQYKKPYALRSWNYEDWKQYIDLLARLRFNLLQIWSFIGSMPDPLSDGDKAFLNRLHKVVDYAKTQRGFEVWVGECANNVAESDGGVEIEKREYFQVEVKKNPGDPEELRDILRNRKNLYKFVDNADGYWIIDSDPGGYPGSTDSEFVNIFLGNRKLIDQYSHNGTSTKLLYWMWDGWNRDIRNDWLDNPSSWKNVISGLMDSLHEPWWLHVCTPGHIEIAKEFSILDKSTFFPYNTIEWEPSTPHTTLKISHIDSALRIIEPYSSIQGAMGNSQTPYVQLPNIAYFGEKIWTGVKLCDVQKAFLRLAKILAPVEPEPLVNGWQAIESNDLWEIDKALNQLAGIDQDSLQISPLGIMLINDLQLQLELRKTGIQCTIYAGDRSSRDLFTELIKYARYSLIWQQRTNYFGSLRPGRGRVVRYPVCGPTLWEIRKELSNWDREKLLQWRKQAETRLWQENANKEVIAWILDEIDGTHIPERNHHRHK